MTVSADLKFSLNAVLALCTSFVVLALVGFFWLCVSTASTAGRSYPPTDWQSAVSVTNGEQKLKTMCGSIAQLLEESSSVIEMQSVLTNKIITTLSWLAIAIGSVGTLIFVSVYRQLRRATKTNAV